jgi:hypothetical protein
MSSGLPINTFSQYKEYRDRYLANLALEVQNDMYNLNANQVFRQTGQPIKPPDMRTTTEKLADLEGMKITLRAGLLSITDGTQVSETIDQLTPDEIIFTSQQLPAIISDLKPRYNKGVPSTILINYIKALHRKELQTNGVSFPAQESTSQQILNAIQAGQLQLGANAGVIPGGLGNPVNPVPNIPNIPNIKSEELMMREENKLRREAQVRLIAEEWLAVGKEPFNSLSKEVQNMINKIRAERGLGGTPGAAFSLGQFKKDADFKTSAENNIGLETLEQWNLYPIPGGFEPKYRDSEDIAKEYLKMWAKAQTQEIQDAFAQDWNRKRTVKTLKTALFPGWQMKQAMLGTPPSIKREISYDGITNIGDLSQGSGIGRTCVMSNEILGYGVAKNFSNKFVGLKQAETSYLPFGKYKINTNKLASGILDIRTQKGIQLSKYKQQQLSHQLSKTMKRIMGGRLIDEYDFKEMPLEDQHLLYNLAKDAHVMDRLNLPTPERSQENEEEHKFEILKGQIMSGNDNKELVKEFKNMLLKMSNTGKINKSDAREILLDLIALGY